MKTVELKLYAYDELSDFAQARAFEREVRSEWDIYTNTTGDFWASAPDYIHRAHNECRQRKAPWFALQKVAEYGREEIENTLRECGEVFTETGAMYREVDYEYTE